MTIEISENMRMTGAMLSKLDEAFGWARMYLCSGDESAASNDILLQVIESRMNNSDFRQKFDVFLSRALPAKTENKPRLLNSSNAVSCEKNEIVLDTEQARVYNLLDSKDEDGTIKEWSARDIAWELGKKNAKEISPILQALKKFGKIASNGKRAYAGRWWAV